MKANVPQKVEDIYEDTQEFNFLRGYTDPEGTLHTTFSIREMDGSDEEAISNFKFKSNSAKVISLILERCCLSIGSISRSEVTKEEWANIIRSLKVGDQDYMYMKIKGIEGSITLSHKCASCDADLKTEVELDEFTINPYQGYDEVNFELLKGYTDKEGVVHKKGVMRMATAIDREIFLPVAQKNPATGTSMMLTRLCTFDSGLVVTQDIMTKLSSRDRKYLSKILDEELSMGIDPNIEIECSECGVMGTVSLAKSNFT